MIENNYLDPETNQLKTQHIYQATRLAIAELEKEGLKGEWTGAVHYNTDNIHVHVGYVEKIQQENGSSTSTRKNQVKLAGSLKGKFYRRVLKRQSEHL